MWNVLFALAFYGCVPGKIGLDDKNGADTGPADTAVDTAVDTGDMDTSVDTALAEEVSATAEIPGMAYGLAGMALAEDDFDGDGADDLLVGAPGFDPWSTDASANPGPGMGYLLRGPIRSDTPLAEAAVRFYGISDWDGVGSTLAYGDFDDDGVLDAAFGGGVVSAATPNASGFVAVAYGPFESTVPLSMATILTRNTAGDHFGAALAVGDFDNDGISDLAVGVPAGGDGGVGEVVIYFGRVLDMWTIPHARLAVAEGAEQFGTALAVGDTDGDGADDLLVGSAGAAYLFLGPIESEGASPAATITGAENGDGAGKSVALADLNNDEQLDAIIGAPQSDRGGMNAGAAYVAHGPLRGSMSLSAADAVLVGGQPGSQAGTSVAYANDLNSDGQADIIVGAPYYDDGDTIDAGRGYIVFGPIEGWKPLAEAVFVRGAWTGGKLGTTALADTELTGDNLPDALFGAPWADAAGTQSGNILLVGGM